MFSKNQLEGGENETNKGRHREREEQTEKKKSVIRDEKERERKGPPVWFFYISTAWREDERGRDENLVVR
jgi:hypothetical protein